MNLVKISKLLTAKQKARAKARADIAGRPYPNYIDNLWVYKLSLSKTTNKHR